MLARHSRLLGACVPIWAEVRPGVEPGLPRLPGRCAATTLPDLVLAAPGHLPEAPARQGARSLLALRAGVVWPAVPPAGLEPAFPSASGRCRGRWATGVSVSSPGWI